MERDYTTDEVKLAQLAKALAHPARIAILNYLATHKGCFFGEIEKAMPIGKSTVSQHLSELKAAGLIRSEAIYPKVKYTIHPEKWNNAKKLLKTFLRDCTPPKKGKK